MNGFAWTEFYSEFASLVLDFENDREKLIEKIKQVYTNAKIKLPTLEKGNNIVDIDPFTIFGLFNKGITIENRIAILTQIKDLFDVSAEVPSDFDGIPVLNNMSATFYHFIGDRGANDIDNLWKLFRCAVNYADKKEAQEDFVNAQQQEFIRAIINYVRENGDIRKEDLLEKSPFDNYNIISLFGDNISSLLTIVGILHDSVNVAA